MFQCDNPFYCNIIFASIAPNSVPSLLRVRQPCSAPAADG